jgi:fucose permease
VNTLARRLTWLGYFALTLVGVYVAALGPGLPSIAAQAHIPLSAAGSLFSALFAGGLLTSVLAGRAMDRFGRRPVLITGMLVNGVGCLTLSLASSWWQMLLGGVLLGTGDSMIVVGTHVLFADIFAGATGAALNRLNVFFGIGALSGPALAGLALVAAGDIHPVLWFVAAGQGLGALVLARAKLPPAAGASHGESMGFGRLARLPLLWALALLLFFYVGLEVGLGNWSFTYLHAPGGFSVFSASLLVSGYWLALTLGRALGPFALRRISDPQFLLAATLCASTMALLLVILAGWRIAAAGCILLVGLSFGPVWPMSFAVAADAFPESTGSISGILATAGSVGGLAGPWLQGILLLQHGVHWGMGFTLAGSAATLLLAAAALRAVRGRALSRPGPLSPSLGRARARPSLPTEK